MNSLVALKLNTNTFKHTLSVVSYKDQLKKDQQKNNNGSMAQKNKLDQALATQTIRGFVHHQQEKYRMSPDFKIKLMAAAQVSDRAFCLKIQFQAFIDISTAVSVLASVSCYTG